MLHAAIISRILLWYQQAAVDSCTTGLLDIVTDHDSLSGASTPSPPPTLPEEQYETWGTNVEGEDPLPRTTGFLVTDAPVAAGTFGIEDQTMRATVRNHLVLSELSKMKGLLDLFGTHLGDREGVMTNGLYQLTSGWLRAEYERVIGAISC